MSNDQPPPGFPSPEDDPFQKRPPDPQPPPGGGSPYGQPPPGNGSPYGSQPPGNGSPYGPPPGDVPPYGSAPPPPYDPNAYGGGGGGYGGDPLAGMPPLADSGKRILARIIDWFIIFVPLAIIGIPLGSYDKITSNTDDFGDVVDQMNSGGQWVLQIISIVAYVGYDWYMTKQSGQTVGKRVMNIRVAMLNDGRVPDSSASMLRAVVLWLPGLICCPCVWPLVLLVLILVDKPYKQGLHDKAGKTVVVSVR